MTKAIGFFPDETIFVKQFKTSFFSEEESTDEKQNAPLGTPWDFEQINFPWFKRQKLIRLGHVHVSKTEMDALDCAITVFWK